MKKNIIIVEILSTGINYVDDALARGYQPVVLEALYPGTKKKGLNSKKRSTRPACVCLQARR